MGGRGSTRAIVQMDESPVVILSDAKIRRLVDDTGSCVPDNGEKPAVSTPDTQAHEKEQIVNHFDLNHIKAVMADREREAQKMRLARDARKVRSENGKAEVGRQRRFILRDPLKA